MLLLNKFLYSSLHNSRNSNGKIRHLLFFASVLTSAFICVFAEAIASPNNYLNLAALAQTATTPKSNFDQIAPNLDEAFAKGKNWGEIAKTWLDLNNKRQKVYTEVPIAELDRLSQSLAKVMGEAANQNPKISLTELQEPSPNREQKRIEWMKRLQINQNFNSIPELAGLRRATAAIKFNPNGEITVEKAPNNFNNLIGLIILLCLSIAAFIIYRNRKLKSSPAKTASDQITPAQQEWLELHDLTEEFEITPEMEAEWNEELAGYTLRKQSPAIGMVTELSVNSTFNEIVEKIKQTLFDPEQTAPLSSFISVSNAGHILILFNKLTESLLAESEDKKVGFIHNHKRKILADIDMITIELNQNKDRNNSKVIKNKELVLQLEHRDLIKNKLDTTKLLITDAEVTPTNSEISVITLEQFTKLSIFIDDLSGVKTTMNPAFLPTFLNAKPLPKDVNHKFGNRNQKQQKKKEATKALKHQINICATASGRKINLVRETCYLLNKIGLEYVFTEILGDEIIMFARREAKAIHQKFEEQKSEQQKLESDVKYDENYYLCLQPDHFLEEIKSYSHRDRTLTTTNYAGEALYNVIMSLDQGFTQDFKIDENKLNLLRASHL